ncbi:MAG: acetate--CoA ligase family protein [Acetobacteraceae bacterium]|nr:acetate--CoA ligase family protein [Acetobacteraceae bacterium]
MSLAAQLLSPRRVALVGASADASRLSARAQLYLRRHGFSGTLYPVNPNAAAVLGEPSFGSLAALPGPVDHAFILVGTARVEQALADCIDAGIPVATILADGFAEAGGEGRALQARLAALARGKIRLLGPNSMGVMDFHARTMLCVNAALEAAPPLAPGGLSVVSHSGSVMGTLLSRGLARGIGFAKMAGTGNEADLTAGEIASLLVEDAETQAILLFLETIRDADRLAAAARAAHAKGKPIIAYKLGRSNEGAALAATHTGAIAGSDVAADAYFRDCGILRVDMLETLIEIAPMLVGRRPPASRRRAVSVMTSTGGGGAMVVDRLGTFAITARGPTPAMIARLAAKGVAVSDAPLTDMTLAGTRPELVEAVLAELQAASHTDATVAVIGSSAQFRPQDALAGIVAAPRAGKPLAVFLAPQADASLRLLAAAGIAAFRTPESCAEAIRAWLDWRAPRAPAPAIVLPRAGAVLDEAGARKLFAALGIESPFAVVEAETIRPGAPCPLPFPVAVKIVSPDIPHKTEVGGVALGLTGATYSDAIVAMVRRVRQHRPEAHITGVLVAPMVKPLAEAILGFRRDPQVGPVVVLGTGGVLTEIHADAVLRLAPVDDAEAMEMIVGVKGLAGVRGYRGLPRGDLAALAHAVACFSRLAHMPDILQAEINPLAILPEGQGIAVLDALAVPASEVV